VINSMIESVETKVLKMIGKGRGKDVKLRTTVQHFHRISKSSDCQSNAKSVC
jgi:hypothetical protein